MREVVLKNTTEVTALDLIKNFSYFNYKLKGIPSTLKFLKYMKSESALCFAKCIEYSAKEFPNNIALRYEDEQYTYQALNERINQVAAALKSKGISNGDVVVLFMENRPEYLIYVHALAKLGAIAALINSSLSSRVLLHSVSLVKPKSVIVGQELLEVFDKVRANSNDGEGIPQDLMFVNDAANKKAASAIIKSGAYQDIETLASAQNKKNVSSNIKIKSKDPVLYIYTSGTTGLPKATIQNDRKLFSVYSGLGKVINRVSANDVLYCSLPLYHATGLLICWLTAASNGASFVIKRKFSASEFWNDVEHYKITVLCYVGELCRYLVNQKQSAKDKKHTVRMAVGNGLKADLWNTFKERFAIKEIRELYASSEGNVATFNMFNLDETAGFLSGQSAIVEFDNEQGAPVKNAQGKLIKVKKGEAGLLLGKITKATPFEGYTQSDANKSKIIKHAFAKNDEWFNTGDLVREVGWRHIQFVDRTGDTYRWKGENISTTEVENVANQFKGIAESIAYGVEIPDTNGRAGMLALVLAESNSEDKQDIDLTSFLKFLRAELPAYAVPVFIRFMTAIETTGTFKYQRNKLQEQNFNPALISEPLFICLPGESEYQVLDAETYLKITQNKFRF